LIDDPPFFLRNSSSETTPPDVLLQRQLGDPVVSPMAEMSNDSGFLAPETNASDEFRSVIDDLTIENKRLKKRLRKYERGQRSQYYPEALFELRVHGLAAERKRELEKLLQEFVSKMEKSPSTGLGSTTTSGVPSSLLPGQSSSNSRIGDSGYVSMSLSGQNSSSMSGQVLKPVEVSEADRKKGIHEYLSDIPTGLLPRRSGPLTDREKRKIVVRKIEQLFAGRDSSMGGHSHQIQQQHVAQSAARADRRANEALGSSHAPEGSREARIMPDLVGSNDKKDSTNNTDSNTGSAQDSIMEDDSEVEQRPTRPLDLDPFRAQVPSENMQYLRHLGFSPPRQSMSPQPDGHGWIHLNILTNMAQTHFEHVTQDFVRNAIAMSSKYLELSHDGRKVRWKGGKRVTNSASTSPDNENNQSSSSGKPGSKSGTSIPAELPTSMSGNWRHKLMYSPLFQQRGEDSEMEDAEAEEEIAAYERRASGSPAFAASSSKNRAPSAMQAAKDDAPIIFYQNQHFYTDMSKDNIGVSERGPGGSSSGRTPKKNITYGRMLSEPVGSHNWTRSDLFRKLEFEKGPLSRPTRRNRDEGSASEANIVAGLTSVSPRIPYMGKNESGELIVIARSGNSSSTSSHTPDPIDFEASGIGGVVPADNFSISVRTKQNSEQVSQGDVSSSARRSKNYAPKIRNLLRNNGAESSRIGSVTQSSKGGEGKAMFINRQILTSKKRDLPASQLPDAVFLHGSSDEEDDDDGDDEDMDDYEDQSSDYSSSNEMPHSAPQKMDWAMTSNLELVDSSPDSSRERLPLAKKAEQKNHTQRPKPSDESSDTEDSSDEDEDSSGRDAEKSGKNIIRDDKDDESIDLLKIARRIDPVAIRRQEREFDSNFAERLADDIPPGSSAATAEGGSGFNSPAERIKQQHSMAPPPQPHPGRQRGGSGGARQGNQVFASASGDASGQQHHGVKRVRRGDDEQSLVEKESRARGNKSPKIDSD
jgi:hypothetical protein